MMTSNDNPLPELNTPHLRLRPFVREDAQPLYRILNQDNILQYFPNPGKPSFERVERLVQRQVEHWQAHRYGWWAVIPHGQVDLVGWNGLQYLPETSEIEIGYLLGKPYWGKGYATEGARAVLEYAFSTMDLDEIIGLVHPENVASQRVLEKSGLAFTRRAVYFDMELLRYTIKNPKEYS
ncbi:MAG: GNAT family N-acetyltransferase [Chloroflexota bacterium]